MLWTSAREFRLQKVADRFSHPLLTEQSRFVCRIAYPSGCQHAGPDIVAHGPVTNTTGIRYPSAINWACRSGPLMPGSPTSLIKHAVLCRSRDCRYPSAVANALMP